MALKWSTDPSISLDATFSLHEPDTLSIQATITNGSNRDIFTYDRLWLSTRSGAVEPEPQAVYRFIDQGHLRLLLGAPPLPRLRLVALQNVPYVTRVKAHTSHDLEITVRLPASEYNPYFSGSRSEKYVDTTTEDVELFVQYTQGVPDSALIPSPFDPRALIVHSVGFLESSILLRSHAQRLSIPSSRRTDEFERIALPGEP